MLTLTGRGAILAGTRRIGGRIAERLADEGVKLALLYRTSRTEAEALQARIVAKGHPAPVLVQADLSVEEHVSRAVEEAGRELGDLSFCINLASDYPRTPLETLDAAAWERGMLAAKASYLLAVHASRRMMTNPGPTRGHLIFFGDWAALETPYHDFVPYLTGKASIDFMTRAFALELAPHGILVNAIAPGPTDRPPEVSDEEWGEAMAMAPLHRESSAAEMAEMITTLLRLETVTGETIRIDSGRHLAGAGPADQASH
jgi:NAD(P)-dependent dehydrogenase (short-subunit alcohol dehydrogenase family)